MTSTPVTREREIAWDAKFARALKIIHPTSREHFDQLSPEEVREVSRQAEHFWCSDPFTCPKTIKAAVELAIGIAMQDRWIAANPDEYRKMTGG